MNRPFDLNRTIIEDLYCEALILADEARSIFDLTPVRDTGDEANQLRLVMSVEGLRTTTRVMHVLAWLLNQRAFFAGELSETQLRRHSKLPPDRQPETGNLELLSPETRRLVLDSQQMHQRIARLDSQWRERGDMGPEAIMGLQQRLGQSISQG
jgi:regulator of CtrA degradation